MASVKCNSVVSLKAVPFSRRSSSEKMALIQSGPPRPKLKIKQASTKGGISYTRGFSPKWYERKNWLTGCEEANACFCYPCLIFHPDGRTADSTAWVSKGVTDMHHLSEKIKKHELSKIHMDSCLSFAAIGRVNIATQLDKGCRLAVSRHNDETQFASSHDPTQLPDTTPFKPDSTIQTDPPHTVSMGTQTWVSPHRVSDGTQPYRGIGHPCREAMVACPRVGPETMSSFRDLPLSSPPIGAPGFSPSNRLCMKKEVEDPITEFKVEPLDPSSNPGNSVVKEEPDSLFGLRATHDNAKYIVFEGCLRELFDSCPVCRGQCEVQRQRRGTYVAFSQHCRHCGYSRGWQSQPIVGSTPLGNLQLSAATYLTGASFFKLAKIFKAMQLQTFSQNTFRRHTQCFLEPAIVHKWKKEQQILFQKLQLQGKVAVCGGMRADSPGHTAKFGSYSLMHMESNTIIDVQLVKSNEVGGNDHMEMEGLKRSLDLLEHNGLEVDYMVAERQPQILNYLMERKIPQFHDVWLLEKVDKILHNEAVFCDVVQMSQHNQTSSLEAFHSLIQGFLPQKVDLPFMGLLCRLYLAIMHYNENAERRQAGTHPGPAVIQTDPTYNYVDALLKLVFEEVVENPTPFVDELKSIPIPDHG